MSRLVNFFSELKLSRLVNFITGAETPGEATGARRNTGLDPTEEGSYREIPARVAGRWISSELKMSRLVNFITVPVVTTGLDPTEGSYRETRPRG